jgi:hypothetical protein
VRQMSTANGGLLVWLGLVLLKLFHFGNEPNRAASERVWAWVFSVVVED